jgi:hypothetical protein
MNNGPEPRSCPRGILIGSLRVRQQTVAGLTPTATVAVVHTGDAWSQILLDGSIGALIAGVVTAGIVVWSVFHGDRKSRDAALDAASVEMSARAWALTAIVLRRAAASDRVTRWARTMRDPGDEQLTRAVLDLLGSTTTVIMRAQRDHPQYGRVVRECSERLTDGGLLERATARGWHRDTEEVVGDATRHIQALKVAADRWIGDSKKFKDSRITLSRLLELVDGE